MVNVIMKRCARAHWMTRQHVCFSFETMQSFTKKSKLEIKHIFAAITVNNITENNRRNSHDSFSGDLGG